MATPNDTIVRNPGELGKLLSERRKAMGLTQQDFADLAGVGRRFLSELENGKERAEIGKVLRVVQALGIDLAIRTR